MAPSGPLSQGPFALRARFHTTPEVAWPSCHSSVAHCEQHLMGEWKLAAVKHQATCAIVALLRVFPIQASLSATVKANRLGCKEFAVGRLSAIDDVVSHVSYTSNNHVTWRIMFRNASTVTYIVSIFRLQIVYLLYRLGRVKSALLTRNPPMPKKKKKKNTMLLFLWNHFRAQIFHTRP